jgi:DNA repair protein RadC
MILTGNGVEELRPREKIKAMGIEQLTTQELFSIILGSGSKHVPLKVLSQRVTQKIADKKKLGLNDLQQLKGIGLAKACQVLAVVELIERFRPVGYPLIDSLQSALNQLADIRFAEREHMVCLYLNTRLQLLQKETIAIGNLNQILIKPRDIFAIIKHQPISNFILAHNHPSGDPTPSSDDLTFTYRLAEASQLLGIELLDHIIIGKHKHYSCREHDQLRPTLPPQSPAAEAL